MFSEAYVARNANIVVSHCGGLCLRKSHTKQQECVARTRARFFLLFIFKNFKLAPTIQLLACLLCE